MSFDLDIGQIIQYAYNVFASSQTVLYIFLGASFGVYILSKLLSIAKG